MAILESDLESPELGPSREADTQGPTPQQQAEVILDRRAAVDNRLAEVQLEMRRLNRIGQGLDMTADLLVQQHLEAQERNPNGNRTEGTLDADTVQALVELSRREHSI